MADRNDLEFTYSLIDRIFRVSIGELADFSGAKYDGDIALTLEEAQRRKHEYVAESIGIGPGRRVLDLRCGWGPLLAFARIRGATGVGVTLSSAQAEACRRHGLDAHLQDARDVTIDTFGEFDAVASLGAFEHFCSPDEHRAGRQEEIYRQLFVRIAGLLGAGAARPLPDGVREGAVNDEGRAARDHVRDRSPDLRARTWRSTSARSSRRTRSRSPRPTSRRGHIARLQAHRRGGPRRTRDVCGRDQRLRTVIAQLTVVVEVVPPITVRARLCPSTISLPCRCSASNSARGRTATARSSCGNPVPGR